MAVGTGFRGVVCMVLACFALVTNDVFMKFAIAEVAPLQLLFLRGVAASLWCLAILAMTGHIRHLSLAFSPWTLLRALCEAVAVTSFILALAHVKLADITAIYQTAPLLVLAGASIVWREQVGVLRWLLIGLGLAGALLVAQPGGSASSPFAVLGIVTAIASAARDLLSRKVPRQAPGLVITFAVLFVVMSTSAVTGLVFETWSMPGAQNLFYLIAAGFFLVFGHFFIFMAFRLASAQAVAPFYYGITLCAVIYGAALFGEIPNALALVGMGLIVLCGLGVLALEQKRVVAP
jgi:drug/metabolite transporter (DMT)-like permease